MPTSRIKSDLSPQMLLFSGVTGAVDIERIAKLEYGDRAFEQDAGQAIRGDPYLALVEAITNSDDNLGNRTGSIAIQIDTGARPWSFSVTDSGDGIAHEDLKPKLIELGNRTSGLETGKSVRGNKGRGARDMAVLGGVVFETIHNNVFSKLAIDTGGNVAVGKAIFKPNADLRARLGIPKNGTRVTVTCKHASKKQPAAMRRQIINLLALRDIMQSPHRSITFRCGEAPIETLRYAPAVNRREITKRQIVVEGYSGKATLVLYQHPKPFDEEPSDVAREGGILIKGGRAVHMSTLFEFEQSPAARRISGDLRWDTLDELIRQYDDAGAARREHPPLNPFSIVRRDRQGLDVTHPAFKALRNAVRPILAAEVKRLDAEMSAGSMRQTEQTRRRFSALAELLGKFWHSKKEELEESGSAADETGTTLDFGLNIMPPRKRLDPYSSATFYLHYVCGEELDGLPHVHLSLVAEPNDVLALSCATVQLERLKAQGSRKHYRGSFKATAGGGDGEALISANYDAPAGAHSADAGVTVGVATDAIPNSLTFEHDQYRLKPGKPKKIRVFAPVWAVKAHGTDVELKSSSPEIVLRKASLTLKDMGRYYIAETSVTGERTGTRAKITASLGNVTALTRAVVTDAGDLPRVTVTIDSIAGNQRATIKTSENGDITVSINGTHPAAARYLGAPPAFPTQDTLTACVLMAEIAGEEIVWHYLAQKYDAREVDPPKLQWERNRELAELLPKIHAIMLPDPQLRRAQAANGDREQGVA